MTKFVDFKPSGVIAACLLPFDTEYAIDEPAYRKHLRDVAGVAGLTPSPSTPTPQKYMPAPFRNRNASWILRWKSLGIECRWLTASTLTGAIKRRHRAHGGEPRSIGVARVSA